MENEVKQNVVTFAAIDPVLERTIEEPTAKRVGSTYMWWGDKNQYPAFLDGLRKGCPTLRSVILGTTDYICGNDVVAKKGLQGMYVDGKRTSWKKFIKQTADSVCTYGGYAWGVTRDRAGENVVSLEVIPLKYLRTDEECATFWYNEKWGKSSRAKEYPAWTPGTSEPYSIYYAKVWGDEAYPEPIFAASVKEASTEMAIADFHLGNIERGFMGSYIVNFNNGLVSDEVKSEIEKEFTEKFAGHKNAGRIMFSFNPNVAARTTLEKMEVSDYGEKYDTLSKHCRQQIFTAFRAHPTLFGLAESSGFNQEEYAGAFKLFNRTMVQPIQAEIIDGIEAVLGESGIVSILPFTMDGATEKEVR